MSDEKTTRYVVSVLEDVGGRLGWNNLLRTEDKAKADVLYASLIADKDVKVKFKVLLPGVLE